MGVRKKLPIAPFRAGGLIPRDAGPPLPSQIWRDTVIPVILSHAIGLMKNLA
jgi:hypothetical protein